MTPSQLVRGIHRRLPGTLKRLAYRGGHRSDRLRDPDAVVAALQLRAGERVADLGPGFGHFTLRLARAVAPGGICYAVDVDQQDLDALSAEAERRSIANLRTLLTSRARLELPEPVDLLFVSATYHHLRDPVGYFAAARQLVRPGGRAVILESRLEGIAARWINPHGSVPARVTEQMRAAGYELTRTHDIVAGHWLAEFHVA